MAQKDQPDLFSLAPSQEAQDLAKAFQAKRYQDT
jgi:hypothetical protein